MRQTPELIQSLVALSEQLHELMDGAFYTHTPRGNYAYGALLSASLSLEWAIDTLRADAMIHPKDPPADTPPIDCLRVPC
jgi:hypothetical protein